MDAQKVIDMLSDRDMWDLLCDIGANPVHEGNAYSCETVCHHGDSKKLVYYRDNKRFHCYTNCGNMSVFDLVAGAKDISFVEALSFIVKRFGIQDNEDKIGGFFSNDIVENPGRILDRKLQRAKFPEIKVLNKNILEDYYELYHLNWLDDGISIRSMKKYGVRFNILENQIVIPHFNKKGEMIGVRARNLKKEVVRDGKKYMPMFHDGEVLKHPTGANLYGLDQNIRDINNIGAAVLFESEKSVLQLDTMFPEASIGLCVSGSNLTEYQIELLKTLEIEEVIIALDREYEEYGTEEEIKYADRVKLVFRDRLEPFFRVSVLWDRDHILDLKDSPTDKGKEAFLNLLQNRIYI